VTWRTGSLLAANHSGDSDSTGAIAGNILGAVHGHGAIPNAWSDDPELSDVIELLCRDWIAVLARDEGTPFDHDQWWPRYPGW
jgi:ADP-ribosyl-[dinitrogen reductase] hydrolase